MPPDRRSTTTPDADADADEGVRVRLFDGDRTDERLSLDDALGRRLKATQLLWMDVHGGLDEDAAVRFAKQFRLAARTARILTTPATGPHLAIHGDHVHLRVMTAVADEAGDEPRWLDVIMARNVVITVHAESVPFLDRLDERIESDATVGRLDAASFARSLLDAAVTTYFEAVDAIEGEVDELDTRSLRAGPGDDLLAALVEVRRKIARLRRALSDHREVFAGLPAADFTKIADGEDVRSGFETVAGRFEDAIHSVEDSRDLLLGSFDVFMTRTAQRTNDVMKVLALATVLLLPGSLIAGLLGMNVVVPLSKDDPSSFWIVLAAIAILASGVLFVARRNDWIHWSKS